MSTVTTVVSGSVILILVFGGMFFVSAKTYGLKVATLVWSASIVITALILVGINLLYGGLAK